MFEDTFMGTAAIDFNYLGGDVDFGIITIEGLEEELAFTLNNTEEYSFSFHFILVMEDRMLIEGEEGIDNHLSMTINGVGEGTFPVSSLKVHIEGEPFIIINDEVNNITVEVSQLEESVGRAEGTFKGSFLMY